MDNATIEQDALEHKVKEFLSVQPVTRKIYTLAKLAHELTVCARAVYPGQVTEKISSHRLAGLNEMQHTITGQLRGLSNDSGKIYPEEVFVNILFETARIADLMTQLEWSFNRIFSALDNKNC